MRNGVTKFHINSETKAMEFHAAVTCVLSTISSMLNKTVLKGYLLTKRREKLLRNWKDSDDNMT